MTDRKLRVAVVFGGSGAEHAASCLSAGTVLSQLDADRFDVVPVGIAVDGAWVLAPAEPKALPVGAAAELALADGLVTTEPARVGDVLGAVDVVFPVLHGTYGEDGTIQGLLELAGIPYAGAGVLASAAAMDKEFGKKLLAAAGLPIGRYAVLRRGVPTVDEQTWERLGLPVSVRPARAAHRGGATRVTDRAELDDAIAAARLVDPKVIVESAVEGREIRCGVLEYPDGRVDSSLPAEIHDEFDTPAAHESDREFDIPAKLPDAVTTRIRELAVRAFTALDCQGFAHVDFVVGPDDTVIVHDLNTMPGFTAHSLYPKMWEITGVDYPTLLTTLVETAVARGSGLR